MSSSPAAAAPKPKKSVALSGVPAGNTALCTVGRTGNDLHYRGYDILEFADAAEFEEVAYLLVHGKLPNAAELSAFRAMNKAALNVYQTLRREGTQKNVVGTMQTRDELYDYLGYHAYERKLDELFSSRSST